MIRKGDKGSSVKTMQTMLITCGYDCGPDGADGDFGRNTLSALLLFQWDHYLEVDGIYGPASKAALEAAYKGSVPAASPATQPTFTVNAEKTIWDYLIGKINNPYGVAALMGNLYAESALRPNNLQDSYENPIGMTDEEYTEAVDKGSYANFVRDSAGYGLAQWTYWTRKEALLIFAKAQGKSIGDLSMQLDFLWKELTSDYTSTLEALLSATSVRAASDVVLVKFENPADKSEKVQVKRASYGEQFFSKYAGTNKTPAESKTGCTAAKLISVAVAELGYHEKASNAALEDKSANSGAGNYTKYARDFDQKYPNWYNGKKNGYAWCDMFVDWCFLTAFGYQNALRLLCQPERSAGAGCTYSLGYFRNKGQFFTSNPKPGDQIFFGTGVNNSTHTGIVEKVEGGTVYTIEGNTSDMVARRRYPLTSNQIIGYGRPSYDA